MYLFTSAKNRIINEAKSSRKKKEFGTADMENTGDSSPTPEQELEAREDLERLEILMGTLTEQERMAITLRFIEGDNLSTIASVLDISVSTTSKLLKKSVQKLEKEAKKLGFLE